MQKNKKTKRWEKVPLIIKEPVPPLRDLFVSCKISVKFSAVLFPLRRV
jgi:hypothetical protein